MQTIATNRAASYEYEILEKFEAGFVLTGPEVKSARAGQVSFKGSYITFSRESDPELVGFHIAAYPPAKREQEGYNPTHTRRLLLTAREIDSLRGKTSTGGLTIVPLRLYTHNRHIKLEIGLAKGKKKYDKRETIKKRDVERRLRRGEEV